MAKLDVKMPDDLISNLDNHADGIKETMIKMCNAAVDYLLPKVQSAAPVYKGYLRLSFKRYDAKENSSGEIVGKLKTYGYEPNSSVSKGYPRGKPNAIKAIVAEYGSRYQAKKPFLRPTMQSNESTIGEIMQKEYDESVEKLK